MRVSRMTLISMMIVWGILSFVSPSLGQNVDPEVQELIDKLRDPDPIVRERAAYHLFAMGPKAAPAVSVLVSALEDENINVRFFAAQSLGLIGSRAAPAVPALASALRANDNDNFVQSSIAEALGRIGPKAAFAVPVLTSALRDEDDDLRVHAAQALGRIGPKAASAVSALAIALRDKDTNIRIFAAQALGLIGPKAASAVPALTSAMGDKKSGDGRYQAAQALGRIGPKAVSAVPALMHALRDEYPAVPPKAVEALGNMGPVVLKTYPTVAKEIYENHKLIIGPKKDLVSLGRKITDGETLTPWLDLLFLEATPFHDHTFITQILDVHVSKRPHMVYKKLKEAAGDKTLSPEKRASIQFLLSRANPERFVREQMASFKGGTVSKKELIDTLSKVEQRSFASGAGLLDQHLDLMLALHHSVFDEGSKKSCSILCSHVKKVKRFSSYLMAHKWAKKPWRDPASMLYLHGVSGFCPEAQEEINEFKEEFFGTMSLEMEEECALDTTQRAVSKSVSDLSEIFYRLLPTGSTVVQLRKSLLLLRALKGGDALTPEQERLLKGLISKVESRLYIKASVTGDKMRSTRESIDKKYANNPEYLKRARRTILKEETDVVMGALLLPKGTNRDHIGPVVRKNPQDMEDALQSDIGLDSAKGLFRTLFDYTDVPQKDRTSEESEEIINWLKLYITKLPSPISYLDKEGKASATLNEKHLSFAEVAQTLPAVTTMMARMTAEARKQGDQVTIFKLERYQRAIENFITYHFDSEKNLFVPPEYERKAAHYSQRDYIEMDQSLALALIPLAEGCK